MGNLEESVLSNNDIKPSIHCKFPKFIMIPLLILYIIGRFVQTVVHLQLEKVYAKKKLGSKKRKLFHI